MHRYVALAFLAAAPAFGNETVVGSSSLATIDPVAACDQMAPRSERQALVRYGFGCVLVSQERKGQRSCSFVVGAGDGLDAQDAMLEICGCPMSVRAMRVFNSAEVARVCTRPR